MNSSYTQAESDVDMSVERVGDNSPAGEPLGWAFLPLREGEVHTDPVSDEFFAAESLAASLVREPVQNSLDARVGVEPVRVRYTFSTPEQQLEPARAEYWFKSLWPHLRSRTSGLKNPPTPDEAVRFLLIEDFGTKGLNGNPRQLRDVQEGSERNDFFYFWRNLGRSGKSNSERGRWGLGKSVFPAASRIHTILGLTRRVTDDRVLLYGQAVLGTHDTDDGHFTAHGFFGEIRDPGTPNAIALPVEEAKEVSAFSRAFCLSRTEEPGFSVVIPHPVHDLAPGEIVREALLHFFYPILAGDLVVEVLDGSSFTRLASDTIRHVAESLKFNGRSSVTPQSLGELMDMAQTTQRFCEEELVTLCSSSTGKSAKWRSDLFPEPASASARNRFNCGEVVGFRVPVCVKATGCDARSSFFDAFFQRAPNLTKGDYHFIRQGITITEVRTTMHRGVRAMLIARDSALCAFLGDAENPAHTQWEERNRHFQDKYEHGVLLLRFVKQSLASIAEYLLQAQEGMDTDLLSGLFFIELEDHDTNRSNSGPRDARGDTPFNHFRVDVHSSDEPFVLSRCNGGFKILPSRVRRATPEYLEIEAAYEVRRGDPFGKYSPLDFDLEQPSFTVHTQGAEVITRSLNRLQVKITEPDFMVSIQGFDPHRDVRVRAIESTLAHDSQV